MNESTSTFGLVIKEVKSNNTPIQTTEAVMGDPSSWSETQSNNQPVFLEIVGDTHCKDEQLTRSDIQISLIRNFEDIDKIKRLSVTEVPSNPHSQNVTNFITPPDNAGGPNLLKLSIFESDLYQAKKEFDSYL